MTLRQILSATALSVLILAAAPDRLAACAFHIALPEATLTDDIAGSIELIAARPSIADPFWFEPVRVLKGERSSERPPYIVDSVTRQRLLRNPDEAVLFARAADGTWTRLLLLDETTWPLAELMVARAGTWVTPGGTAERRDTFAELLVHPDVRLRRIALRELDGIPYEVLREGTYPAAAEDLLQGLASIDDLPFAPIRVLLLGLDDSDFARRAIRERLASMTDFGLPSNLGPWIVAAVESGGADGLAEVERLLSSGSSLTGQQLVDVVRAFSVLSSLGDSTLRDGLDAALRRLVTRHPRAAPLVAQAFGAREDYSQVHLIGELVAAGAFTDQEGLMAAAAYLGRVGMPEGGRMVGSGRPTAPPALMK